MSFEDNDSFFSRNGATDTPDALSYIPEPAAFTKNAGGLFSVHWKFF